MEYCKKTEFGVAGWYATFSRTQLPKEQLNSYFLIVLLGNIKYFLIGYYLKCLYYYFFMDRF